MNAALWRKAIRDARVQLVVSSVLLALFAWLFVRLMSHIPTVMVKDFVRQLLAKGTENTTEALFGVPIDQLATFGGRLAILYAHVIVLLVCVGWAIARGSDVVSGEISRGTMDLLLTLPIRRAEVVAVSAVVTALGAVVLGASVWLGTWISLQSVEPPPETDPTQFLGLRLSTPVWSAAVSSDSQPPSPRSVVEMGKFWPGVGNLSAVTFCLAGLTALLSSLDHSRGRTIWLAGGLFVVSLVVKLVGKLWEPGKWMLYLSFLTPFEPHRLILGDDATRGLAWLYDGTLLVIGLCGYAAAAVVFSRRDIPSAY